MKLHIIGSSSAGNGYVLESETSALIIECGVPFNEMLKAIDFQIEKIAFGVCSHSHGDHSKYLEQYLKRGIKIANNVVSHHNSIQIEHRSVLSMSGWSIIPLRMNHDVECYGFLIKHKELGTLIFATDTDSIPYKIKGINHAIVEANYSQEYLDEKQINHKINGYLATRVENSHLSFEKCREWLNGCDLNDLQTVVLIHLSDSNAKSVNYVQSLQSDLGVPVTIAESGIKVNLGF